MKVTSNLYLLFIALFSISVIDCKKSATTAAAQITPALAMGKSYFTSPGTGADANTGVLATSAFKTLFFNQNETVI